MRRFKLIIETNCNGCDHEEEFEVHDDASIEEVNEMAQELVNNFVSWSVSEIK